MASSPLPSKGVANSNRPSVDYEERALTVLSTRQTSEKRRTLEEMAATVIMSADYADIFAAQVRVGDLEGAELSAAKYLVFAREFNKLNARLKGAKMPP